MSECLHARTTIKMDVLPVRGMTIFVACADCGVFLRQASGNDLPEDTTDGPVYEDGDFCPSIHGGLEPE